MTSSIMPETVFTGALGGAVGLAIGALIVRSSLKDDSAYGAAWNGGNIRGLLGATGMGFVISVIFLVSSFLIGLPTKGAQVGPLTRLASHPGFGRIVWIVIALLLAPVIEELLFHGIILGGMNRSFGIPAGVIISNLLFIALHIQEAIYYWPAFIGLGLMALISTRQRMMSRAVGPAIAVHFGYNLVLVAVVTLL